MERKLNKLLTRQIKKHFGSAENIPEELKGIFGDINNTYENFEDDIHLLQNSIEISSHELRSAYQKHKEDAETQKKTISKINEAIQVIKPKSTESESIIESPSSDSTYMFDSLIHLIEDRNHAEAENIKLSIAVEQNPASIVITDINGNIEYVNPKFCDVTGYTREEAIGENPRILKSETTTPELYINMWNTILSGKEWKGEFHNKKKNGELFWELASVSAVKNSNGEIVNFLAIKEDITNRKKVTEALELSEKKYREVVENVKEIIFQTDADGLWLFLNNAWEEITGYSVEESLGQLFVNFVHPDDRQRNIELFKPLIQREKDYCRHQIRYLTKDGGFRWIEVFARLGLNEKDEITGTYGTLQDITERKQAEETLQNERTLFRTIIDLIPDAIYVKDLQGRKIIANPKEVQFTGKDSEDEIIGKTDSDLYPTQQAQKSHDEDLYVLQSGKPILNIEGSLKAKDGHLHSLLVSKVPLYDVQGKITGIVGVSHDITERKQMENQLKESEILQRSLLESIAVGIVIIDPETRIIESINTFAALLIGDTIDNIVGRKCHQFMCPALENSCPVCDDGKEIDNSERFLIRADKTMMNVLKTVKKIQIGGKEKLLESFVDITIQKQAEEAFQQSSKKWEAIIAASPDGIGLVALDGKLQLISDKLAAMYGYSSEDIDKLLGTNFFEFIDPSNHHELHDNIQRILAGESNKKITEYLAIRNDNSRFYVDANSTVLRDADGKPESILFIQRDITERKHAERALQRSETLLRSIMDTTSDVIFVKDRECRFVYINPAGCVLNGKTQQELIGYSKADFMTNLEELAKFMEDDMRIIEKGNSETFEEEIIGADGNSYIFLTTKVPRFDGQGNIIGLIGMAHDITKRKKAEEALYQSNKKWEAIISASPDGIGMVSLDGKLQFMSDKLAGMYGYTVDQKEEYVGVPIFNFIDPSNHKMLSDNYQKLLNGENDYKITEYLAIRSDRSEFYVDVNSTVLNDAHGNPVNILFIERDITERKQAESELIKAKERAEDSERKFKSIIQSQAEGIGFVNKNEVFEFANTASERIFETEENELIGTCLYDYLKQEERAKVDQQTHNRGEGNVNTYELKIITKKGNAKYIHVTATPKMDENNKYLGAYGVFRDITDQKKAEDELIRISKRLALATFAGGVGVWDLDIESDTLVWDDQMFALYGVEKANYKNAYETWIAALHPDDKDRAKEEIQKAIGGIKEFNTEFRICWPDGSIHNIRALANVQSDVSGKTHRIIGTNWDITEQKKTESILLKARQDAEMANKAKSVFLANMSHEIRTPLNAILGFSQLMNRDKHLTPTQREYNISIIRAGEHLLSLINDILELSKMEAGRLELNPLNVDLNALLSEIQLFFKEQIDSKHLHFKLEKAKNLPRYVLVDDNKLRRIFINLIGNAIKFTDEGEITVRVQTNQINRLKSRLIVEIQDTGSGIPENEIGKLFKHFVQTSSGMSKTSGTGLGLALSRELANLMGGDITVRSEFGKGSVFTFYIVIETGRVEDVQEIIKRNVVGIENELEDFKILVVDDTDENRQVVVKLLDMVGFKTREAIDGEDAILKFEEWNPHLILMDMRMPVLDGYEATRRIKLTEKGKHTPIVALTASSFEDERKKIGDLDIHAYIRKPFREIELFGTIGNILDINYIYDDENTPLDENHAITDSEIIELISQLPDDFIAQIQNATIVADLDLLIDLIRRIEDRNSDLARHLTALANNYDYENLQRLLNKKKV
jgi:PAS domain S-box-containing protein